MERRQTWAGWLHLYHILRQIKVGLLWLHYKNIEPLVSISAADLKVEQHWPDPSVLESFIHNIMLSDEFKVKVFDQVVSKEFAKLLHK